MYAWLHSNPDKNTRIESPDEVVDRAAKMVTGVHRISKSRSIHCDLSDEGLKITLWKDDGQEPKELRSRKLTWEEIQGLLPTQ